MTSFPMIITLIQVILYQDSIYVISYLILNLNIMPNICLFSNKSLHSPMI